MQERWEVVGERNAEQMGWAGKPRCVACWALGVASLLLFSQVKCSGLQLWRCCLCRLLLEPCLQRGALVFLRGPLGCTQQVWCMCVKGTPVFRLLCWQGSLSTALDCFKLQSWTCTHKCLKYKLINWSVSWNEINHHLIKSFTKKKWWAWILVFNSVVVETFLLKPPVSVSWWF